MFELRRAGERGHTQWGWLDSWHTFSFGDYEDPKHMGFGALRVLNDDRVQPGQGFGAHAHRDMEILSYVLEGALEHKDSSGGGGVIRPGEIQFMRGGSGVTHSEYNHSRVEPVHFLQVWIVPAKRGLEPTYGQRAFDRDRAKRSLILLASRDGREGSLQVEQDVSVWMTQVGDGGTRELSLAPGRRAWIHVARGSASVNGIQLHEGDGAGITDEGALKVLGGGAAEILVFDLK
jgi:redox-sensitive bicupin YhaK (pirin superfamily)